MGLHVVIDELVARIDGPGERHLRLLESLRQLRAPRFVLDPLDERLRQFQLFTNCGEAFVLFPDKADALGSRGAFTRPVTVVTLRRQRFLARAAARRPLRVLQHDIGHMWPADCAG